MWFRFSRPDYFYLGHYRLVDAGDASPWNRGLSIGFGFFVLNMRWNEGRSESDGVHYPTKPHYTINVNGQDWPVSTDVLSYELIRGLAGVGREATITYREKAARGRCGTLTPGERVLASEGMIFTAVVTNAA